MLLRRNKAKKKAEEEAKIKEKALNEDKAAIKIQCMVRKFLARRKVIRTAKANFQRVFDPMYKRYFWFDKLHNKSDWKLPKHCILFQEEDFVAVAKIQRIVRGFVGRCRARHLANKKYTRYFDADRNAFYWVNNKTNETTYDASNWLKSQNIDMPTEDKLLLQSQLRIKELEKKLAEKEQELKEVRRKRYEDLEPEVIQDKIKDAKHLQRSRHMDEWTIDELCAWFTELKMEDYIPTLFSNRVDGLLFVNLSDDEIMDLGITSKFHVRKLQLILKSYRARYQQKKDRRAGHVEEDEDDDLLSEYSPSELSAIIAQEEAENDMLSNGEGSDDDYSMDSGEDEVEKMTEEQRLQKRMDETNIAIERIMDGDNENFPIVGDIVRLKYTCTLAGSNTVIMSTKHILGRPWVEFVLGINQVIKGFDRALPLMSVGERCKMTFTPEYGYGAEGLPPHIPPNSSLTFDVTLLGYRPRSLWVKPLIQDPTTHEKPYHKDMKISMELASKSGMGDPKTSIYSTSMVLREEEENSLTHSRLARLS